MLKKSEKITTCPRYVREVRSRGKPLPSEMGEIGEYRELQFTKARSHDQKPSQKVVSQ